MHEKEAINVHDQIRTKFLSYKISFPLLIPFLFTIILMSATIVLNIYFIRCLHIDIDIIQLHACSSHIILDHIQTPVFC